MSLPVDDMFSGRAQGATRAADLPRAAKVMWHFVISADKLRAELDLFERIIIDCFPRLNEPTVVLSASCDGMHDGLRLWSVTDSLSLTSAVQANVRTGSLVRVAIPLKRFVSVTNSLEGPDIEIMLSESVVTISDGHATFELAGCPPPARSSGSKGKTHSPLLGAGPSGPRPPNGEAIMVPARILADLIRCALPAVEGDSKQSASKAINVQAAKGRLRVAGTNGHRLHVADANLSVSVSHEMNILIPVSSARSVMRLCAETGGLAHVSRSEECVFLQAGQRTLAATKSPEDFPDYESAIPADVDSPILMAGTRHFACLLNQAIVTAPEDLCTIAIRPVTEGVSVSARTDGIGTYSRTYEVPGVAAGPGVFLNGRYLLDALAALGVTSDVYLHLGEQSTPVKMVAPTSFEDYAVCFRAIIMPLQETPEEMAVATQYIA